jgi:hypothetical protein
MWWRYMRDDIPSSRGPGGSPSDPGGLVGPQGSAPAPPPSPSRETLIRHLKTALDTFMSDERDGWYLNMVLMQVEGGMQDWRAETPLERSPGPSPGRPTLVEGDAQSLLDLRAANPRSDDRVDFDDCRADFVKKIDVGKQRARVRYDAAAALAAELIALSKKPPLK